MQFVMLQTARGTHARVHRVANLQCSSGVLTLGDLVPKKTLLLKKNSGCTQQQHAPPETGAWPALVSSQALSGQTGPGAAPGGPQSPR